MPNSSRSRKRGVFPGQFDPITNGHLDVIRRGTVMFDELVVAVGVNPDKKEMFSLDERVEMISELLKDVPRTRVEKYTGLTADFVRRAKATAILRGIRDVSDLRYEFQLALANRTVGNVETVFIMTGDQYALTSSSLIRQIVSLGGDLKQLSAVLPPDVIKRLRSKQKTMRPDEARPTLPVNSKSGSISSDQTLSLSTWARAAWVLQGPATRPVPIRLTRAPRMHAHPLLCRRQQLRPHSRRFDGSSPQHHLSIPSTASPLPSFTPSPPAQYPDAPADHRISHSPAE